MHSNLRNKKKNYLFNFGHDILISTLNNYNRVKPENIIKLNHYMHDGLSIQQNKYCKTTLVSAWNLVCGRFVNSRNGRKFLTLLTFVCPTDDYCDFCAWVDRQCDVIIIEGHIVCAAVVNEKIYWSSFYYFHCSSDRMAAWYLSPFCCPFLARGCILVHL